MDLLKASIYILIVSVSINLVAGMMNAVGMTTTYNATIVNDPDPDDIVDTWAGTDNPFYDIATGLVTAWTLIRMLVQGFPEMLAAYGAPTWITEPLFWIYRLIWLLAITLGILAGRQT